MFVPSPFVKGAAGLFAFNKDSFERIARSVYYGDVVSFKVEALWFSKSKTTLGSLVLGNVVYSLGPGVVNNDFTMTYEDFLRLARKNDTGPARDQETLWYNSRIVLSDTKIWGSSGENELEFASRAIEFWKNLPELPEGWDGWFKQTNRRA